MTDKGAVNGSKKKIDFYYINVTIGLAIMALFWFLDPIAPITAIGMKLVGVFLGMVYLWSTVGVLWPSLLGLVLIGLSGYAGEGIKGFSSVFLNAIGADTVLLALFCMVLFGALDEVGCTKYIAKWFMTRNVFKGRPYVFLGIFYLTCWVLSTISAFSALFILWPIAVSLMANLNIKREDQIWKYFFIGMFIIITIGQTLFPFKGAPLAILGAFEGMSKGAYVIDYTAYILLSAVLTVLVFIGYLAVLKLIIRPDVSKLRDVDPLQIESQMPLPPMNFQQKSYLWMVPIYLLVVLAPSFLPKSFPLVPFFSTIGPLGVTLLFIILFLIVQFAGKPMLDFTEVGYRQLSWGVLFLVAAAVYGGNALSDPATGVSKFLIQVLNPILHGHSEIIFVVLIFITALIVTNFANNAAMAIVLMPVILAFSGQMGIDPRPIALGVTLLVFMAMLTPAASPHASMMHGRQDIYDTRDIISIGLPACIAALLIYICICYPLSKVIFSVL